MDDETHRRIQRLENEVDELHGAVSSISTNIALLTQSMDNMAKVQDRRSVVIDRVFMIGMGVFVSAFVTWVIRGGLT